MVLSTIERLDWFYLGAGSISKTGAFIVLLMVTFWAVLGINRRWAFWVVLIANGILGCFLIQTYSRGALLSLIFAFIAFLIMAPIRSTKLKIVAVCLAGLCAFLYSNSVGFNERIHDMVLLKSSSANVRYDLYSAGIKMLTDAPCGFKDGTTPAKIYMLWYQKMYTNEGYNTLINSHLEFLNRAGVPLKLLYILFWSFIFCATFAYKKSFVSAAAFAAWLAFFSNSFFSNIATFWALWAIPVLFLCAALYINRKRFLCIKFYARTFSLFCLAAFAVFLISYFYRRYIPLKFAKNEVLVGNKSALPIYILNPNEKILGQKYGMEIAEHLKANPAFARIGNTPNLHTAYKTVVAEGDLNTLLLSKLKSEKFVFLNPKFKDPKTLAEFFARNNAVVILGDITDFRNKTLWRKFFKEQNLNPQNLIILGGVENYIPNWTKYL